MSISQLKYILIGGKILLRPAKVEVDAAAQAWVTTPEQVVGFLNYIVNQE